MVTLPPEHLQHYFEEKQWKLDFQLAMHFAPLNPLGWTGEDRNLKAFNNKDELVSWFCYHPVVPEPYRDYGFYIRELTALSSAIDPAVVVELGTDKGIGTYFLHQLNPGARLYTIDNRAEVPASNNIIYPTGHIAKINNVPANYLIGNSWDLIIPEPFNLCFIDADHSYESVLKDSFWAWANKDKNNYVILWHDYMPETGVPKAISEFSQTTGATIYKLPDSTMAWTYNRSIK